MVDFKAILNVVPTVQAASLVSEGLPSKRKKKHLDLFKYGTRAIVGTGLIQAEEDLIASV